MMKEEQVEPRMWPLVWKDDDMDDSRITARWKCKVADNQRQITSKVQLERSKTVRYDRNGWIGLTLVPTCWSRSTWLLSKILENVHS